MLLDKLSNINVSAGLPPITGIDPDKRGAADISYVSEYVASLDVKATT